MKYDSTPFIDVFIDKYKIRIPNIYHYLELNDKERLYYWLLELELKDYVEDKEKIKEGIMNDLYEYQDDFDLILFIKRCKEIGINFKPYVYYYNKLRVIYD